MNKVDIPELAQDLVLSLGEFILPQAGEFPVDFLPAFIVRQALDLGFVQVFEYVLVSAFRDGEHITPKPLSATPFDRAGIGLLVLQHYFCVNISLVLRMRWLAENAGKASKE
jgi:hypothetical protein